MGNVMDHARQVFKKYGDIEKDGIVLKSNHTSGTTFAFIQFTSVEAGEDAIREIRTRRRYP